MPKPAVTIRQTVADDIAHLAVNLREQDKAEIAAYGHTDARAALRASADRSLLCWSGFVDDELAAVFGVSPLSMMGGVGSPWLMGTPVLERHVRVLTRTVPDYIARMLRAFPHLVNFVHVENTTSVRWLRRLGFTLHDAVPYGARGEMFHPFEMRA